MRSLMCLVLVPAHENTKNDWRVLRCIQFGESRHDGAAGGLIEIAGTSYQHAQDYHSIRARPTDDRAGTADELAGSRHRELCVLDAFLFELLLGGPKQLVHVVFVPRGVHHAYGGFVHIQSRRWQFKGLEDCAVVKPFPLRPQVSQVPFPWHGCKGDYLRCDWPQRRYLVRVVRVEFDRLDAEVTEDREGILIRTSVHRQAQLEVGIDGVEAFVLELICPDLVGQTNSATLVALDVQHHSTGLSVHDMKKPMELLPTVTPLGGKNVSGEALGVNPSRNVPGVLQLTLHDGDNLDAGVRRAVDSDHAIILDLIDPNQALSLHHWARAMSCYTLAWLLPPLALDELLHAQHGNPNPLAEVARRRYGGYATVFAHEVREHTDRHQASELAEFGGCLRSAQRLADATLGQTREESVTRLGERARRVGRVAQRSQRLRSILRRQARAGGNEVCRKVSTRGYATIRKQSKTL
mmetsp:Transcript_62670/g.136097  ORF Transcript_62670/g.136097 Transcript_62670/m.136097 type:complete len:466 (+) Transcript_62670:202-1599(+)